MEKERETISATAGAEEESRKSEKGLVGKTDRQRREESSREGKKEGPTTNRRGRPNKANNLTRERSGSEGSILEHIFKRKREIIQEEEDNAGKNKRKNSCTEIETGKEKENKKVHGEQQKGEETKMAEKQELDDMSDREILMMLTRQLQTMQISMKAEKDEIREDMRKLKEEIGENKRKQEKREKEMEERIDKKIGQIEKKLEKTKGEEMRNIEVRLDQMERKIAQKEVTMKEENAGVYEDQMKRMLRVLEKREREDRRRNLIIKGFGKVEDTTELKEKHSNSLHNLKYANYVGDEDSKNFKGIMDSEPYADLTVRCIGGYTQNSNESFNSTVWSMAPKSTSSGKHVLDTAIYIAVGIYNDSLSSVMRLMQNLGMKIGTNCYNFCVETDERRIK
ncbi:hypothetical protein EAG_10647 [Camponotus floridanus]|uniref:Uncharacterized protein n=1 Tax=Camponotus floridanus TaxID=104421 RepID=E2ASY4_CAMFO|nr:hypothetical protein EAG_10647 [Camponotus floridanus]